MLIFKILSLIYLFLLAVLEPAKYTEFTKWVWVARIGHQGVAPGKALQEKDSQVSPYRRHNSTKASLGFQWLPAFSTQSSFYAVEEVKGRQGRTRERPCVVDHRARPRLRAPHHEITSPNMAAQNCWHVAALFVSAEQTGFSHLKIECGPKWFVSLSTRILEGSQCAFIIHMSELPCMLTHTHTHTHTQGTVWALKCGQSQNLCSEIWETACGSRS